MVVVNSAHVDTVGDTELELQVRVTGTGTRGIGKNTLTE
jgi:hypothetical protein